MRVQRYEKWFTWIKKNRIKDLGKYWHFIINGRGVGRHNDDFPFNSDDGSFFVSFWTLEECIRIHKAMTEIIFPITNETLDREIPQIVIRALTCAKDCNHGVIITVA